MKRDTIAPDQPSVLIVDDDEALRFMVREALEQEGFVVAEADDGVPALEMFETLRPDVVLLDLVMKTMDGFETCSAIRSLNGGENTPIMMMTGRDDVESIRRAFEAGATTFITKPVNYLLLTYRLRYILRTIKMADSLRESEARLFRAQRIARLGHWEWSPRDKLIHCSEGISDILGLLSGDLRLSRFDFLRFVHPADRSTVRSTIRTSLRNRRGYSLEHRIIHADGLERFVHQEAEVHLDDAGTVIRIVGIAQDITERRRAEAKVQHLAYFDTVTGLPNRSFFNELLDQALISARRHNRICSVLFVDLDNFKRINDTLGHSTGDKFLRDVAQRLAESMRKSDNLSRPRSNRNELTTRAPRVDAVTRLGGDEFVILLPEVRRAEDAAVVAARLAGALSKPFSVGEHEVTVSASIGISVFPADGDDSEAILKNAESAMYNAKEDGKHCYKYFTENLNKTSVQRLSLENKLRKAIENNELTVFYQPIVNLQNRSIVGAEALARWCDPDAGFISPADFIPIAEETGLIVPLGKKVLRTACEDFAAWQKDGTSLDKISVNISAMQIKKTDLVRSISSILKYNNIQSRQLHLELTEGLLFEHTEDTVDILEELHSLGVGMSIDDFGTGYSSLTYLKKFPIHTLKIDRSFVNGIATNRDDAAIVKATIALAHSLQLNVIAEGVETPEQLSFLQKHGCNEVQGFLLGRPCPADDFGEQLRARSDRLTACACRSCGETPRISETRTNSTPQP